MFKIKEFIIHNHIRAISVKLNSTTYLVIDLPALPWCFKELKSLKMDDAAIFYSSLDEEYKVKISKDVDEITFVGTFLKNKIVSISARLYFKKPLDINEKFVSEIYTRIEKLISEICKIRRD